MNKVDLILTNNLGQSVSVDVEDFPYRLNRNVFSITIDKIKTLGGTFSTEIKLSRSKLNNQFFTGKTEIKSVNKFYNSKYYEASIVENGVEILTGKFKLEEINNTGYIGTFFDKDISWLDDFSKVKLNRLGYVNDEPTWVVDYNAVETMNLVNEQTNRQTDFICPTIIYNNTPLADYLGISPNSIWGTYDVNPSPPPAYIKLADGGDYPNDFKTQTGYFGTRLGLTFEDFPPAIYYRNLLEKIVNEFGYQIDCPLFNEEWFNKLYIPYTGDGYKYNWQRLSTAFTHTPETNKSNIHELVDYEGNTNPGYSPDDVFATTSVLYGGMDSYHKTLINITTASLNPPATSTGNWAIFNNVVISNHSLINSPTIDVDYINPIDTLSSFNNEQLYIVPVDGRYTIRAKGGFNNTLSSFKEEHDGVAIYYDGEQLIEKYYGAYAGDTEQTFTTPVANRPYGWDDNVLIIERLNESGGSVFSYTLDYLNQWVSNQTSAPSGTFVPSNAAFLDTPSDIIAYFSPKRQKYKDTIHAGMDDVEIFGSPITDWVEPVTVYSYSHDITNNTTTTKTSESYADIEIVVDLKQNERIKIYWASLSAITFTWNDTVIPAHFPPNGLFNGDIAISNVGQGNNYGLNVTSSIVADHSLSFENECGDYMLNLAQNLPEITCKDFLKSFINQFNLFFTVSNNTIQFIPESFFFSNETYDITSRVLNNNWVATPIDTPKQLTIGYNIDGNDRLLVDTNDSCTGDIISSLVNYGNITLNNDNIYADAYIDNKSLFSSTKFYSGNIETTRYATDSINRPPSTDIYGSGIRIITGIYWGSFNGFVNFYMDIPSIQDEASFKQSTVGDLEYNYNYTPRLLYHLGTISSYLGVNSEEYVMIGAPRSITEDFIRYSSHWYRPTVSSFDTENNNPYRTLRYDTENGLYNQYFENFIDLYNRSEILTLRMAMRNIDWVNMKNGRRIKYQDSLYRLMSINQYDPLTNIPCTIKLLKEI